MVPRQRKCPPNDRSEDGLCDGQGNNVAFAREQPTEDRATDEGKGYENGVRPMQQAEECPCDEGGGNRFLKDSQETIHEKRLQPDFLKQAKSKISSKPARFDKMGGEA